MHWRVAAGWGTNPAMAVSPSMRLRLSRLFGNTPEFWLNAQCAVDLWNAERENKLEIEKIKPLQAA